MALGLTLLNVPRMRTADVLAQRIVAELNERGFTFGVDFETLREVLQRRDLNVETIVARGERPDRGRGPALTFDIEPAGWMDRGELPDEHDRYQILRRLNAGDVIARKSPPVPAQPGHNVLGQELRPRGNPTDTPLPVGPNAAASVTGLELLATAAGLPRWRDQIIEVVDARVVFGDVDVAMGTIAYDHNIEIYGSVNGGSQVIGGADVSVLKHVDCATVTSRTGRVSVKGAVVGKDGRLSHVMAAGDIRVGGAHFASLESHGGSITVDAAVAHSELKAAKDVILQGGPAVDSVLLAGRNVRLGDDIHTEERPIAHDIHRDQPRIVITLPATIEVQRAVRKQTLEGEIASLSASGLRLRSPAELRTGERLVIGLQLPWSHGNVKLHGQVLRQSAADARSSHIYAIRFVDIDAEMEDALGRFCIQETIKGRRAEAIT